MGAEVGKLYEFTEDEFVRIVDTLAIYEAPVIFSEEETRLIQSTQTQFNERED